MQFLFETARATYDSLCEAQAAAGRRWREIPGVGSGPYGLTPDAVKRSPEYRDAKRAYDAATAELKRFAVPYLRTFKRDIAAERHAKRAALMARHAQAAGQ